MRTQSVVFEELIIAIDAAGLLQGDDMDQNADPQTFAPSWAHGVETAAVLALSNGDQLGASNAIAIIQGPAFPDGPHHIPLGGHGGENIDLANEGASSTPLIDLGLRVKPGKSYTVSFQVNGDTMDEFGCSIELVFQDEPVREPKFWISRNNTTAVVNVEVPGVTPAGGALPNIPPGDSVVIGGVIGCGAGDMAALGVNHIISKLSRGTIDHQEILLSGVGGELIIGSGAHISPTQRHHIGILVKPNTGVYTEFMSIIEAGVMDGVISLGFVVNDTGE